MSVVQSDFLVPLFPFLPHPSLSAPSKPHLIVNAHVLFKLLELRRAGFLLDVFGACTGLQMGREIVRQVGAAF